MEGYTGPCLGLGRLDLAQESKSARRQRLGDGNTGVVRIVHWSDLELLNGCLVYQ